MTPPLIFTVLPRPTHPTRDGLAIRNFHLLAALADRFRVRSFVLVPPHLENEPEEYPAGVEVERIAQPSLGLRQVAALGLALAGGAYSPRLYASRALADRLAQLASREKPSWVIAQSYHVAPAARAAGAPVWVDFHNVDSRIWRRLGETASSPAPRRFARSQAPRVERFEREILGQAEGLSCVSEIDAAVLRDLEPRATPLVVPNGVDLARYALRTAAPRGEVVFFVGDLTWAPNAEGIRWFRREVWPAIKRLRPDSRAEILGRGGERLQREVGASNDFVFLGAGGDTRPAWQRAAVAIVPLFSGGGTRLKILEAAACGVPVVSTPIGVEGLSFPPEEVLVRDDPAGFAEAIARTPRRPGEGSASDVGRASARRAGARLGRDWIAIRRRAGETDRGFPLTALAVMLLGLAAGLFAWSYLVYPAVIARKARRQSPLRRDLTIAPKLGGGPCGPPNPLATAPDPPSAAPPSVEVLVSAADEEGVIARRIENLLSQSPAGSYGVTVGCDGCRDRTAEAARAAGGSRIRVIEFEKRRGKAAVLNDLVAQSAADVLVFTDANTEFDEGAVARLVAPFSDPPVGAVCGRLVLESTDGAGRTAETVFWDRETRLKEAEGRLGVCLGANGAIYAARRELVRPLPEDTSMDDFLIPARIARQGRRVVFARDAVAREPAPGRVSTERARRFRLGIGAGQVLRREGWLFDASRHPGLTFVFLSRKAARWLAPVLALLGLLAAAGSARLAPFAVPALAVAAILVWLPEPRRLSGPAGKLYYFCVMNVVLAAGVLAGLFGMSRPAWARTPR